MSFQKVSIISFNLDSKSTISLETILAHAQSIDNQEYANTEHIIICPQQQINSLAQKLPNVKFISESSSKISDDLNQAIKIASADIISFVDINNFLIDGCITKVLTALSKSDIVIPSNESLDNKQFLFNYLKYWNHFVDIKSVFVKKSILDSVQFFDKTLFDGTFDHHYFSDLLLRLCIASDKVLVTSDFVGNVDVTSTNQSVLHPHYPTELRRLFRKFEKVNCGFESRFSYVIPISEYGLGIEELLSSIEKQNFPDIEVIVVGMSCDNRLTQKKLRLFEDNLRKTSLRYVHIESHNIEQAFIAGCRAARSALISCVVGSSLDDLDFTRKLISKFENDAVGAIDLFSNNIAIRKLAFDDFETSSNIHVSSVLINDILNQLHTLTWQVLREGT